MQLLLVALYVTLYEDKYRNGVINKMLFSHLILGYGGLTHIPFPRTTAKILALLIIVIGGYLYNWWQNRR